MSSNMQRLGDTLSSRMKKTAGAAVTVTAELGIINSNMSLTTDSLKTPIPKGEYMINLMFDGSSYSTSDNGGHGGHIDADATTDGNAGESGGGLGDASLPTVSAGEHNHSYTLRGLQAGDRVLVIWCGFEPVVVAVVVSS